jgi:large subunit ribosomal protein L15
MTSGKGTKGQKSRSGAAIPPWFEGGQMPLQRRTPKRGFTNIFKKCYGIVNVEDLKRFPEGSEVGVQQLLDSGLIKKVYDGVKLLGRGELDRALSLQIHKASASAVAKIEAAGGRVDIVPFQKGK